MAPKRRTASGQPRTAPSQQQPTLSFANRVTKPSTTSPNSKKRSKKAAEPVEDLTQRDEPPSASPDSTPQADPTTSADLALRTPPAADPLDPSAAPQSNVSLLGGRADQSELGATGGASGSGWVSDEEGRARKVSEAQIKKYWRAKEQARLAPRVHQEALGVHEKVLREWDMSGEYGPCIGIARLKRWKRANVLGLEPPIEVLAVLLREMEGGGGRGQRAYVDELMNSHGVVEV